MADCSYARCLQERRSIRRELQRWTKNMVYVVGLERVAEELMGRRKWKLYQDVLLARNLPLQQPDQSDSPAEPTTTDNQDLTESQEPHPQETPTSEGEERPMIATTEALQRNSSATDLTQDPQDQTQKTEQEKQIELPPIQPDEDSKEAKESKKIEEAPSTQKEENCNAGQQITLKIKTIEQINTVGNSDGGSGATETILESLIKRSSTGPPRKPQPADWRPQDKCYFCVDGELVRPGAEQAAAPDQPPSPPVPGESGSESGSSRSGPSPPEPLGGPGPAGTQPGYILGPQALAHLLQLQQNRHPTMNQVQSMAASLAAVAALGSPGLGGLPPLPPSLVPPGLLPPHWYLPQRPDRPAQQDRVTPPPRASPPAAAAEQPLDLSARPPGPGAAGPSAGPPSPSALEARLAGLRGAPIDPKMFNRAKPRLVPSGGRRAYTEAELQMALREIQSGRLGTRRAAVIYNIPRSTLRNKVYKLEREREARLPGQLSGAADRAEDSNDITDDVDDDKDSIMDEDKEEDRELPRPLLTMQDIMRYQSYDQSENLRSLLQKGGQKFFDMESPKRETAPEPWSTPEQNVNNYIQSLLMASGLGAPMPKPEENSGVPMMPEIVRLLAEERHNILKEQLMKREHLNNGKQTELSEEDLATNKRIFSRQSSSASSVITRNDRATPCRKTDSPEDVPMEVEQTGGESRESPSNVILKIPSFKPLAQGSSSGKNGSETFPGPATPPLPYFSRSPHQEASPASRPSDRLSPSMSHIKGMFSLKDVIAKSISQKFQQHGPSLNHNSDMSHLKMNSSGMDAMEGLNAFKRGGMTPPVGGQGISVIKNLTSHDLTRSFGSNNTGSQNQQNNTTGGKGTRPKRGKYRNYDRDSLVEAVKAVQRGEMSVHRAGSYYGVPHSTLEYKVKERHLMRPRKREPKNPNPDDKLQATSASKPADIPGAGVLRAEKPKVMQKPPTKPNFPASSPNGLKMPPIFDGNLGLGYNPTPFPFWPHAPPFPGLPVEFSQRNPGTSGGFPPNTESFFAASQMMQRLQEESSRHPGPARSGGGDPARDMADLYEGTSGANGAFLEGIIRSSLERPGQGESEAGEASRRRLRPDDLLLAEEMREAARRLRAREAAAPPPPAQPHPS